MRRLLKDLGLYWRSLADGLRGGWNRFFFSPADPTTVGLIRAMTGLLAFWSLLVLGMDLDAYLGSGGWQSADLAWSSLRPFAWSIWFLVGDAWLRPAWVAALVVILLFSLGAFSRVTAVLSWVIVVSTIRRAPAALFGFDQVISMLLIYLAATGSSGQAFSLDRYWRRWREARKTARALPARYRADGLGRAVSPASPGLPPATVSANIALRMIQLHLVVIYGIAGLAKLQGPSWWNGEAVWRMMATGEFVILDFTPLARWPMVLAALTHASLALELLYPVLIWNRLTRPLVLAGVVGLHLGIAVVNPGLAEFALVMLTANLAFVSGLALRRLATGIDQPAVRVLFDGACPRCRGWMALLSAADPDHVLEPVDLTAVDVRTVHAGLTDEACLQAMHAVTRDGRVTAGFDALRAILLRLPLFWPAGLAGFFPGVAWAGRIGYNWYAASRPRDVPCTDMVCSIHSRTSSPAARDRVRSHAPNNATAIQEDS